MSGKSVNVITLGCSKNLVDSERMIKRFQRAGFEVRHDAAPKKGEIAVINTCGFIADAKEESIQTILQCVQAKEKGFLQGVYVMGCLSQRYPDELKKEIPGVDAWYGKFDWENLVKELAGKSPDVAPYERTLTTPSHYAYLKIAEGCDRHCAFCAIPLITGKYRSRSVEEILEEVRMLVKRGVKEFNVIAQELTYYGRDLYGSSKLAELTERMAQTQGVEWIRLHYAYPAQFPMELLDVMARHENVCKYLDIALQHISDKVLGNMRRNIDKRSTLELIEKIRQKVPGIHLRTTLMTGFPGEGEEEFEQLKEFVRQMKFERMGAFAYCEEEGTFAAKNFEDSIPQETKDARLEELMKIQEGIALESNRQKVGKTLKVIIDSEEQEYFVGRTQWDSPEVDPEVLVKKSSRLKIGEFSQVKILEALPFELIGEPVLHDTER